MKARNLVSLLAATVLVAASAHATTLVSSTSGIASPAQTIDFSGQANGTDLSSVYAGQGITFTGLQATSAYGSSFTPTSSPAAVNFSPVVSPFEFNFSTAVTDLSFYMVTDGAGTTVDSYLNGFLVESLFVGAYSGANSYFGFTGTLIDQVIFTVSGDQLALIDDVAFTPSAGVPDSGATVALLGASLLGLAALRRRK